MAKVTHNGLAKPDHPIYKSGLSVSVARSSPSTKASQNNDDGETLAQVAESSTPQNQNNATAEDTPMLPAIRSLEESLQRSLKEANPDR